jgi:hypothetical protein
MIANLESLFLLVLLAKKWADKTRFICFGDSLRKIAVDDVGR